MTQRTPKPNTSAAWNVPEPPPADYSDELTAAQLAAMRMEWTQDEAEMGPLVHEFKW